MGRNAPSVELVPCRDETLAFGIVARSTLARNAPFDEGGMPGFGGGRGSPWRTQDRRCKECGEHRGEDRT